MPTWSDQLRTQLKKAVKTVETVKKEAAKTVEAAMDAAKPKLNSFVAEVHTQTHPPVQNLLAVAPSWRSDESDLALLERLTQEHGTAKTSHDASKATAPWTIDALDAHWRNHLKLQCYAAWRDLETAKQKISKASGKSPQATQKTLIIAALYAKTLQKYRAYTAIFIPKDQPIAKQLKNYTNKTIGELLHLPQGNAELTENLANKLKRMVSVLQTQKGIKDSNENQQTTMIKIIGSFWGDVHDTIVAALPQATPAPTEEQKVRLEVSWLSSILNAENAEKETPLPNTRGVAPSTINSGYIAKAAEATQKSK